MLAPVMLLADALESKAPQATDPLEESKILRATALEDGFTSAMVILGAGLRSASATTRARRRPLE
jgi:hypothetical protein